MLLPALFSAALAGETLDPSALRTHLTQTQARLDHDLLVAAWTVEDLRAATERLEVEGLVLAQMGREQGLNWLAQREDCVVLVERLDAQTWAVQEFGDCSPPPVPEYGFSLLPHWNLGVSAGGIVLGPWGSSGGLYTGFELGSPVSIGLRGQLSASSGFDTRLTHQLFVADLELLLGLEARRNSFQLGGGLALYDEHEDRRAAPPLDRQGSMVTASMGWSHLPGSRTDSNRRGHGLLLRTALEPGGLKTVELHWSYRWEWRAPGR
jgi:hypothetical protein